MSARFAGFLKSSSDILKIMSILSELKSTAQKRERLPHIAGQALRLC